MNDNELIPAFKGRGIYHIPDKHALFFFNGESLTVPSKLTKLKAAKKMQAKKAEAIDKKAREARQAARELEEHKKIEKMFGELVNPNV